MKALIALLVFLSFSCQGKTAQSTIDIIENDTLTIRVDPTYKDRFYYKDDFGNLNFLKPLENKFILQKPYFELIDGQYKIPYILKKGENIQVLNTGEYAKLQSNDSLRNTELLFAEAYFKKFDYESRDKWLFQKSLLEEKYIKNLSLRDSIFKYEYNSALTFLKEYQQKHKLSNDFYQLNQQIIKYKILERNLMADFRFPKSYVDSLGKSALKELDNDAFLFFVSYRNSALILFNILRNSDKSKSYTEVINANFKNKTKDFLVANLIVDAKKSTPFYIISKNELDTVITDFLKTSESSEYYDYVKKTLSIDKVVLNADEVINVKNEKLSFNKISSNKITYLDFWASWCAPCRAEMPDSKKLKEEYTKKGVNFTYISIDENAAAWLKAMQQIGLSDTESYLLPKGKEAELAKKLHITTIPRYMIIDKNNRIINIDAPRPSDPKIRQILNELLKK